MYLIPAEAFTGANRIQIREIGFIIEIYRHC